MKFSPNNVYSLPVMPNKTIFTRCLVIICSLILNGCSVDRHDMESFHASKNPDGTWNIQTTNLKLSTLIEEWAKLSGVVFSEIAEETEDHRLTADINDMFLEDVMEAILLEMDFVYHDREGHAQILTLEAYRALPPVRIEYPIHSKDVGYALRVLSSELSKEHVESEPNPVNATIAVTATWADHDRLQNLILYWGALEPAPAYPEMNWPESLPEKFTKQPSNNNESQETSGRTIEIINVRHECAERLVDKLQKIFPLKPDENMSIVSTENFIIVRGTEGRVKRILEVVSYLDDPMWLPED